MADEDAWKQQNKAVEENPMYKYVNLDKGGRLIDAYIEGGAKEVRKIILEEMQSYLYNGGKGKTMTKVECIRWQNMCTAKMDSVSFYL